MRKGCLCERFGELITGKTRGLYMRNFTVVDLTMVYKHFYSVYNISMRALQVYIGVCHSNFY